MKKTLFLLFLLLQGCLTPLAPIAPMGASKETSGDSEKSQTPDNFISAPTAAEPPPAAPPAEVAPPASPPASPPVTPFMRTLPDGAPATGGDLPGDHALAYVSPGPLDPKTDQGQAEGLPCSTHHMKYGPNFSQMVFCFTKTPISFPGDKPTVSFVFRAEEDLNDGKSDTPLWTPLPEGYQVRLVYQKDKTLGWSSYVDAVTDSTPEDGNVEFTDVPAAAGSISLFILRDKPASPPPSGWKTFDNDSYENFVNPPVGSSDFIPVGHIKLDPQMTTPAPVLRRVVLPPQEAPPTRLRALPPKDIFQSAP